jgi:hypothetical protein
MVWGFGVENNGHELYEFDRIACGDSCKFVTWLLADRSGAAMFLDVGAQIDGGFE